MSRRGLSVEEKAASVFVGAMSMLSYDPRKFAALVAHCEPVIVKRAIETFMVLVDALSQRYDENDYQVEDLDLMVSAKRIQDAMVHYRP